MSMKDRGFASMPLERVKEIASMGGRATQARGGRRWTKEEAQEAGRKGVQVRLANMRLRKRAEELEG